MSRVSKDFGALIKSFMERNSLTFRAAALESSISAAYWKDMSDGRVPSEEVIAKISESFEDLDENELRLAAGYGINPTNMDAVKAVEIALRANRGIPEEGMRQILDFVKEVEDRYGKR